MRVKAETAREEVFGIQFAYLEFDRPQGAQIIRHRFKIKVWELRWDIDPAKVLQVIQWPAGFDRYLKADNAVVIDDRFRRAARDIVGVSRGAAEDLGEVMDWLQQNMTYDPARASLRASSAYALLHRTGDCSDYHGLCAAFGRALGLPTRVTYGLNTFPKNSPSHCKVEAYLPPYGWVSFDVSETQKLVQSIRAAKGLSPARKEALARAATERLRRGFRDNTYIVQTRGTDYELAPKASRRVNVVRTVYAEADGKPLPEPHTADPGKNQFAWMTAIDFKPDRDVAYPYKDWGGLVPADQ
jgi:transglutaminase-like putative cysteine protease